MKNKKILIFLLIFGLVSCSGNSHAESICKKYGGKYIDDIGYGKFCIDEVNKEIFPLLYEPFYKSDLIFEGYNSVSFISSKMYEKEEIENKLLEKTELKNLIDNAKNYEQ